MALSNKRSKRAANEKQEEIVNEGNVGMPVVITDIHD
jgi:hypothetical protein